MEMYGANILKIHPMIDMKDGSSASRKNIAEK